MGSPAPGLSSPTSSTSRPRASRPSTPPPSRSTPSSGCGTASSTHWTIEIESPQSIIEAVSEGLTAFTIFMGSVAGISLLVGGIGIMNVMLVSVTERIREIGVRKAMGAKRRDILSQFVLESVLLTLGGGIAGALLGIGLSRLVSGVELAGEGSELQTMVTPDVIVLVLTVSISIGLFFGIYPAFRAAGLHPIEALRHE